MCKIGIRRVVDAEQGDVLKGIIRLHKDERAGVEYGSVCRVKINGRRKYLVVRGLRERDRGKVRLDDATRAYFGVEHGMDVAVDVRPSRLWGDIALQTQSARPGIRFVNLLAFLALVFSSGSMFIHQ